MRSRPKMSGFSFAPAARAPQQPRQTLDIEQRLASRDLDETLTQALMESFPASDPISSLRLA